MHLIHIHRYNLVVAHLPISQDPATQAVIQAFLSSSYVQRQADAPVREWPDFFITSAELYALFNEWLTNNPHHVRSAPRTLNAFSRVLTGLGYRRRGTSLGWGYDDFRAAPTNLRITPESF